MIEIASADVTNTPPIRYADANRLALAPSTTALDRGGRGRVQNLPY